jgi:flagellar biosynthesis regulator FlaF
MKLPSYEGDDVTQAKARFAEIISQAEALAAASASRAKEIQEELAGIEKEKARIATMTVDEELAADPKLASEIDAAVEKDSFLVTP